VLSNNNNNNNGVIEMLGGAARQKFAYHLSHRDEAIVYDTQVVETLGGSPRELNQVD